MTAFMPAQVRRSTEQVLAESVAGEATQAEEDRKSTGQKGQARSQGEQAKAARVADEEEPALTIQTEGGVVDIGGVRMVQDQPRHLALLPNVVFFDIPKHVRILREMLKVRLPPPHPPCHLVSAFVSVACVELAVAAARACTPPPPRRRLNALRLRRHRVLGWHEGGLSSCA